MATSLSPAHPLHAFDSLRSVYPGPKTSVRCVEVDVKAQRLYAASSANAVLVWDLTSRKPLAALKHPLWVNAVRRYPPVFPPWQAPSSVPAVALTTPPADQTCIVLTGCEDGVVTAWSPETFKIVDQARPGFGAITALHVVTPCSGPAAASRSKQDTLCFATSLEHVFVLQAMPRLVVLQDLVHPGVCLTLHVATEPLIVPQSQAAGAVSADRLSPLVIVGQEDGTLVCWSCTRGTLQWDPLFGTAAHLGQDDAAPVPLMHKTTLPYPTGECDVEQDARESPHIHRPGLNIATGELKNTFAYNSRQLCPDRAIPPSAVADSVYLRTVPLQSPAARKRSDALPAVERDAVAHYDRRRVTCLAGAPAGTSSSATRFFSGHATGEVLIWDTIAGPRSRQCTITVLLKKILAFSSGAWVYNMVAMTLPTQWHAVNVTSGGCGGVKQPLPSLVKKGNGANTAHSDSSRETVLCSPVLAACADDGDLVYIACDESVRVATGPGFVFTGGSYWCEQTDTKGSWPAIHAVFGSFEGRVESFDVTAVVTRLRAKQETV